MEESIKNLMDEEIKSEIEGISHMELGSDEHSAAVENLTKLYRLRIDETKNEQSHATEVDRQIEEAQTKILQMDNQKIDRWIHVGTSTAELILPLIFYGVWMHKGLKFEETGALTSSVFRGLTNRFKPTKK
jgi:hypothetical protein